ncbi:MAG: hypothetical protein WCV59_00850 [Parcubacteria group bacterium]|jgi:hypothetical protein
MVKEREIKQYLFKKRVDAFFTFMAVFTGIYFGWNMPEIVIFGVFVWSVMNPIPSRYLAILALCFLSITPFFLIFGRSGIAEQSAVYAYYFLAMTVIMGVYELKKEDKQKEI